MIYVATVCKLWARSGRPLGDFACFINKQKSQAIRAAIGARKHWERSGEYGPYRILVGTLTEEVAIPTEYRLRPVANDLNCEEEVPTRGDRYGSSL